MYYTHVFVQNIGINVSDFLEVTFFCPPGITNVKEVQRCEFMIKVSSKLLF